MCSSDLARQRMEAVALEVSFRSTAAVLEAIRVLMTELNRISSHLVALATGGMDVGALSMMLYGFREREALQAASWQ